MPPRHVGLNLTYLVPGETGGMEIYARELLRALADTAPELRFTAFVNREAAAAGWLGGESRIARVTVPVRASDRRAWVYGEQVLLPRLAARAGVEVLHSLGSTAPARGRFRRVTTIHDLHYRTIPEAHFGLRALGMRVLVPLAARRSHRVIAVSHAAARELVELLKIPGERIDVVPHGLGASPQIAPAGAAQVREQLSVGGRALLLSVSAKRPHKNLIRLLEALARRPAPDRPVLVLPGYATSHEEELRARAAGLGVAGDVRFLGWVSEADLEGFYAAADAFVFPSLAEGFGLPVLEAMQRGVPVACSTTPAVAEVAGDAAATFDPLDVDSINAAIDRVLADPGSFRAAGRRRAADFSWGRAAEGTLASYRAALTP